MTATGSTSPAPAAELVGFEQLDVRTLNELLVRRAELDRDAVYCTFLADGDRDERTITHGELLEQGLAVARLLAERGLAPGDRVLIMLDSGLDFIVSFFGILLAGMVPVPVYPPARLARLEHYLRTLSGILETAQCRAAIADRRLVPLVGPRLPSALVLLSDHDLHAAVAAGGPLPEAYPLLPSSPGFMQFTSGTTQRPRGVLLLQEQIMAQLDGYCTALGTRPGEVAVSWLPMYHDLGLIGKVMATLYARVHLVLLTPVHFLKEPMSWIRALSRHRGNHTAAPNFAFQLAVRKCPDEKLREENIDLSCVTNAGSGGECVSMAVMEAFAEKFAPFGFPGLSSLNPSYGLAENTLVVSTHRAGEGGVRSVTISREAFQRNEIAEPKDEGDAWTIPGNGKPLDEITVRIIGEDGAPRAEREIGQVWVRSPSLAAAYFRNGEATAKTFVTNEDGRWLRTGDLGFLAAGDVYVCGRHKDLMIVRGRNYHPQDIEEVASKVKGVRAGNVAAFSVEDESGGERPILVCEVDDRSARPTAEVRAELVETIANAFTLGLEEVIFVPKGSLPKTSSGKLQRGLVKEAYRRGALDALAPPGRLTAWRLKLSLGMTALRQKVLGSGQAKVATAETSALGRDTSGVDVLDPRIVEALGRARPELAVAPSPRLRVDALGLGSMELMELWVAVERLYDARVPDADWEATQTLGEVQRLVERFEGTGARRAGEDDGDADTPLFVRDLLEAEKNAPAQARAPWRAPLTAPVAFGILRAVSWMFWGHRVRGLQKVPGDGGFILAGNHVSYLDPAWVRNSLDRDTRKKIIAMAWEGAPAFTRWFVSQVETIPIDPSGNFRGAMQAGLQALREGRVLLVFPEGARSHTGTMDTFRPGIGLLGLLSQRPIVPFRIRGAFEIFPRDRALPRFIGWRTSTADRLEVSFGDAVIPPAHEPARTWAQARALVEDVRGAVEAL